MIAPTSGREKSTTPNAMDTSSPTMNNARVPAASPLRKAAKIVSVAARVRGRAVCLAFAAALRRFGIPGEGLTNNGKRFTDRFGKSGEGLFDRICRDNGITHRLAARPPAA